MTIEQSPLERDCLAILRAYADEHPNPDAGKAIRAATASLAELLREYRAAAGAEK